jgi:hypothetical protein
VSHDSALPVFHRRGDPDGDFYALAYCAGTYTSPTGSTRTDGYLVLSFSPSPDFSRLSFHTETSDGGMLSYSRGSDDDPSPAVALVTAWYAYQLPPHAWKLYPPAAADEALVNAQPSHRAGYADTRRLFAKLLYQLRGRAWFEQKGNVRPLFAPADVSIPDPLTPTPENEDVFRVAFAGDPDDD